MRITLRFSQSTARRAESQTPGLRAGFGLVEVIVAMILLAVAVSALAGLSLSVSQSSLKVTGTAYRNGVMMQEVNRLEALPYDSLQKTSCNSPQRIDVTTAPYQHSRYITICEPSLNLKTVKIVLTPVNSRFKPDTVNFTRTRPRTTRVLNTTAP
jgi:prepilin-type N-terminal cleavage/methylation domain-containing protein